MNISPLYLAPCTNRRRPIGDPDPSRWLYPALPTGWKLFSFHFSINWRGDKPVVDGPFLMCRLVEPGQEAISRKEADEELLSSFDNSEEFHYFRELERVSNLYGRNLTAILLPEDPSEQVTDETIFWTISGEAEGDKLAIRSHPVSDLKRAIRGRHGIPTREGGKGLTLGTSKVECYLSTSWDIFPGDVDAVVVDERDCIRHLIEYKKHTIPDKIDNHLAQKYYRKSDPRKYQSLQALTEDINRRPHEEARLTILYYSTRSPSEIRLQEVSLIDDQEIHVSRDSQTQGIKHLADSETSRKIIDWLSGRDVQWR